MRPVSRVSLRPPHSTDLRLISNMFVLLSFIPTGEFPGGRTGGGWLFGPGFRILSRSTGGMRIAVEPSAYGTAPIRQARRRPAPSCLSMSGRRTGARASCPHLSSRNAGWKPALLVLSAQSERADQGRVASFVGKLQVIEQGPALRDQLEQASA